MMSHCTSAFEQVPAAERGGTHTCDRDRQHHGPHRCPTCGARWIAVPGPRPNYLVDERGIALRAVTASR